MPLLVLAALVVIVLMLYIALGGKEGAPTVNLNKIIDFIVPKGNPEESAGAAAGGDVKTAENAAPSAPEQEKPAPAEASAPPVEDAQPAEESPEVPADAAFSSMEELTEFYRKEAERLTGIKH